MKVEVRKEFQKIPVVGKNAYFWALLIDSLDAVGVAADVILGLLGSGIAGIGSNIVMDGFQSALALVIFENPEVAIIGGGGDLVIPPTLDVFPTFTAAVFVLNNL